MLNIPFSSSNTKQKQLFFMGLEDLQCNIIEITPNHSFEVPQNPIDNGTYISDTIYKLPIKLNILVWVGNDKKNEFIANLQKIQFSNNMFKVVSFENIVYENLKITNFSETISKKNIGATYYNISLEEVVIVKALTETYKNSSNPAYSDNTQLGTKSSSEKTRKSTLKGLSS